MVEGVDAARFVQRVAKAFAAMNGRGGPVRLKLSPPELGSLRMEITVRSGTLHAKLEAETSAAKSVLLDNLPVLRERLAEQNIKVERFDVDVAEDSGSESSQRSGDEERFHQPDRGPSERATDADGETDTIEDDTRGRNAADGRLDIVI